MALQRSPCLSPADQAHGFYFDAAGFENFGH
jgi:hypothetical protein